MAIIRDQSHLVWPFFEPRIRELGVGFAAWRAANRREFENDEGGDGVLARNIFRRLDAASWLEATLTDPDSPDDHV